MVSPFSSLDRHSFNQSNILERHSFNSSTYFRWQPCPETIECCRRCLLFWRRPFFKSRNEHGTRNKRWVFLLKLWIINFPLFLQKRSFFQLIHFFCKQHRGKKKKWASPDPFSCAYLIWHLCLPHLMKKSAVRREAANPLKKGVFAEVSHVKIFFSLDPNVIVKRPVSVFSTKGVLI